jgi:SAM-dependent methyltransferase
MSLISISISRMALPSLKFVSKRKHIVRRIISQSYSHDNTMLSHYSQENQIMQRIIHGFSKSKKNINEVTVDDLSLVDEFHIGGVASAKDLFAQLNIKEQSLVLDVGCGIGGPSRLCAHTMGCSVIGIDMTPEYVSVGNELSGLPKVNLRDKVNLIVDDACALDNIDDNSVDAAFMLHVGMNIKDKDKCASQVYRVLKPGGRFGIFDLTIKSYHMVLMG